MPQSKARGWAKTLKDGNPLSVLVLNASLKHSPDLSNTEELATLVLEQMRSYSTIKSDIIRLADQTLPAGLGFQEAPDDDWPGIVEKIKTCDILLMATPIWWGQRSSLMQRVVERFDALDEEYHGSGRNILYNKVAGIIVTGSEDGAQQIIGSLMEVLTFFGFTLPPECAAYWVGEVGQPPAQDRDKRLKNEVTKLMAAKVGRNLMYFAQLLRQHPLQPAT